MPNVKTRDRRAVESMLGGMLLAQATHGMLPTCLLPRSLVAQNLVSPDTSSVLGNTMWAQGAIGFDLVRGSARGRRGDTRKGGARSPRA
eukprot:13365-Rhodomonas_salina.2